MFYFFIFLTALILAAIFTSLTRKIAFNLKIVDHPDVGPNKRKIHQRPTPLLGGIAIFGAYFILLFLFAPRFLAGDLSWSHLLGFFGGGLIIIIGGILDDKYNLRPWQQIIFPLLAIGTVILGGVEITKITNPLGGVLDLTLLPLVSPLLIALWLLGLMYTTKLLDGVDGLVSGVSVIGGLVIFLFTFTTRYYQPDIAFAAILLAGVSAGFLIFNFNPAKIFLGEGGSLLLGYILGVLAIISGGKIAIALLIMGIPILDVAWTIIRRLLKGKNPFKFADREHLHHRFLALGLNQKETVIIFYLLSLIFGLSGLFLQSRGKFLALLILLGVMFLLVIGFWILRRQQEKTSSTPGERLTNHPTLLLQICCAPCGTYISRDLLQPRYDLTWYFCNPNLCSRLEYQRRLKAVKLMAAKFGFPLIVEPYRPAAWQRQVKGQENDPERGERCRLCYHYRLAKTAQLAKKWNFSLFSTTLLVSPYKDTDALKTIGQELAQRYQVEFLAPDFQADDGYKKSQSLAQTLGLYRQKFCGCEYSRLSEAKKSPAQKNKK